MKYKIEEEKLKEHRKCHTIMKNMTIDFLVLMIQNEMYLNLQNFQSRLGLTWPFLYQTLSRHLVIFAQA